MAATAAATRWPTQVAPTEWTREQDKMFERALLFVPEELPDRWDKIAEQVPGKSAAEVRDRYEALVRDVYDIDSGLVEVPSYADDSAGCDGGGGSGGGGGGLSSWDSANQISFGSKPKHSENERKKGTPWTEEEHRYCKNFRSIRFWLLLFLFGVLVLGGFSFFPFCFLHHVAVCIRRI